VFIDDVVTSGTTVQAARRALIRAGLGDVVAAVTATSPGLVATQAPERSATT